DATLCSRHDPLIFLLQRTGKNNVRIAGRIAEEEINRYIKLELLERAVDKIVVRQRNDRIETDRKQSTNFVAIDLAEDFVSVHAGCRQFLGIHSPNTRNVCTVLRVADVAHPWQLVALLAMFTSTLTVALPGDRSVTAAFAADPSRCQDDVDCAQDILNSVAAVFDTAGVHEKTGFGCSPPFCRLQNSLFCNSRDLCGSLRSPFLYAGCHLVESKRVVFDE